MLNKNKLDEYILGINRDNSDLEIYCKYYDEDEDVCKYPNDIFYGQGCYGKNCVNYVEKVN